MILRLSEVKTVVSGTGVVEEQWLTNDELPIRIGIARYVSQNGREGLWTMEIEPDDGVVEFSAGRTDDVIEALDYLRLICEQRN